MAKNDLGLDWANYQGANGVYPPNVNIRFAFAQVGGITGGVLYDQWTYNTQIQTILNKGQRAHTYIWFEVGGSTDLAKKVLDYHLPKVTAPKGSIVALDYESGASGNKTANTDAILYGMRRVREAGFTPMYYSYKPFTLQNVEYQRINSEFPNSLWIAAYGQNVVGASPNFNYFPSMDGIAIWQFTSNYIQGGLDGNIDLTGITDNGYGKQPNTPNPPAVVDGVSDYIPNKELLDMYLIFTVDTKRWYISNGVGVRYVRTTRMLSNYQNDFAKLKLPTDKMYQVELDKEFGVAATKP